MRFFRKHQKKIIAVLALLLAVLMILPAVTMILGNTAGAITQAEIDEMKKDAAALAQQKKNLNNQLSALKGEINSAHAQKLVVEQEINVVEEQITNTEGMNAMYDPQIAQEEINLAEAQAEEARHFETFCARVRAMEEQGTASYWQILFGSASFTDLLDRAMMINEVVQYDNAVKAALEQAREGVEQAKAALEGARAEQVAAKEALDAQNAELRDKRATIDTLLAELQAKESTYRDKIASLDEAAEKMDKEIGKMQEELKRQIEAGKIQFVAGSGYIWPLDGYYTITSFFGPRIHPVTGKPGNHGGTDVRAPYGVSIKSARGGVVMKSTYNDSYGNYVVVGHDNGVSTLYAHMSKRSVKEGDIVSQGQELGKIGSTGSSTGNHLHYEIRVDNVRKDAIDYYPKLNLWYVYSGKVYPLEH